MAQCQSSGFDYYDRAKEACEKFIALLNRDAAEDSGAASELLDEAEAQLAEAKVAAEEATTRAEKLEMREAEAIGRAYRSGQRDLWDTLPWSDHMAKRMAENTYTGEMVTASDISVKINVDVATAYMCLVSCEGVFFDRSDVDGEVWIRNERPAPEDVETIKVLKRQLTSVIATQ